MREGKGDKVGAEKGRNEGGRSRNEENRLITQQLHAHEWIIYF